MPWTAKSFKEKHNKSLTPSEAVSAVKQASAMLKSGVDEGIAIATANKRIARLRKSGQVSEKSESKKLSRYAGS